MTAGRPKKYTKEWMAEEAKVFLAWLDLHKHDKVIWFKDFAIERGYDPTRLTEFEHESEQFSLAIKKARAIQESMLAKGSLENKLNNATSIFLLKAVHGYQDKVSMEHSGPNGKPIEAEFKVTFVE